MKKTEEDKTKHLEFILQIIARMNSNSFLLKGWIITLNAALIALFIKNQTNYGWLVGMVSGYLFWILDAHYLSIERKYRKLYNQVRVDDKTDFQFTLDVTSIKEKETMLFGAFTSLNLLLFYGTIIVLNFILCFLLRA